MKLKMAFETFLLICVLGYFSDQATACHYLTANAQYEYIESHAGYGYRNYDNNYADCWIIDSEDPSNIVELTVVEFDLEYSTGCRDDFLAVYSGQSALGTKIGQYCGQVGFTTVYSSDTQMYLNFHTDFANRGDGFQLKYRNVDSSFYIPPDVSIDFDAESSYINHTLSVAVIIGIVITVIVVLCIIAGVVICIVCMVRNNSSRGVVYRANGQTTNTVYTTAPQPASMNTNQAVPVGMQPGMGMSYPANQQGISMTTVSSPTYPQAPPPAYAPVM